MAGTRTVHRGSRGRFAGASSGKAENIKVGRGYSRGGKTQTGGPKPVKQPSRARRVAGAAKRGAAGTVRAVSKPSKARFALTAVAGVAAGAYVGSKAGQVIGTAARDGFPGGTRKVSAPAPSTSRAPAVRAAGVAGVATSPGVRGTRSSGVRLGPQHDRAGVPRSGAFNTPLARALSADIQAATQRTNNRITAAERNFDARFPRIR